MVYLVKCLPIIRKQRPYGSTPLIHSFCPTVSVQGWNHNANKSGKRKRRCRCSHETVKRSIFISLHLEAVLKLLPQKSRFQTTCLRRIVNATANRDFSSPFSYSTAPAYCESGTKYRTSTQYQRIRTFQDCQALRTEFGQALHVKSTNSDFEGMQFAE
jgi:hypothetical protein